MRSRIAKWLGLGIMLWSGWVLAASFDHDATRFPLDGFHRLVECEVCHVNGRFEGTPMQCESCHGGSSVIPAGGKSPHHLPTTDACEDCHRTQSWETVVRFDHTQAQGTCEQCHNGTSQSGKPANHIVSSNQCDSCHNTVAWQMARFDHSGITAACSTCHNNVTTIGKPNNHVVTIAECDTCHNTNAWHPARFDHSNVTGTCSSCHNGSTATGKHNGHIMTTSECDTCHTTMGWIPAHFDHAGATGSCSSCHNGMNATGKGNGHFVTNRECDYCHTINGWSPLTFTHHGSGYPGEHRQRLDCNDCHQGNVEANVWKYPAYQPDCAGCHANRYKADAHKKVDSPAIFYTVSELRDCSGACHEYTDSTFTTIRRTRTGQHRVNSSSFGD